MFSGAAYPASTRGVMSYGVTRRTREIGIRMAVGGRAGHVLWLVLRGTFGLVAIGVMFGFAGRLGSIPPGRGRHGHPAAWPR